MVPAKVTDETAVWLVLAVSVVAVVAVEVVREAPPPAEAEAAPGAGGSGNPSEEAAPAVAAASGLRLWSEGDLLAITAVVASSCKPNGNEPVGASMEKKKR